MFDLSTGQAQQVAAHDAPIKCARFVETNGNSILITAGWDKKLKVSCRPSVQLTASTGT